ncbi:site-specific integrase [Lentzea flava]|uniref:Site-specific integrase n=1 Tax=Lentzea flava TaxID=103732 RepID=A0ABQ2UPN4_9PSEU|nr:site-specific integrase [Lentzea flava]MCP2200890.1 Site-specific recombinase XerD [Lentzea flava]GGU47233.1 site-specific integrase [Lentzea flava]
MASSARANGEGSIYPHRNGFAAYVWVTTPSGEKKRKYVYGPTREVVHEKWIKLHQAAKNGPVATSVPRLREYLHYWLNDVIKPNRAPLTYVNYELFVRLYINPTLGDDRLDKLKLRDVQKWINAIPSVCQCCAQGKDERRPQKRRRCCALGKRSCCGEAPSARTISDIRACLRSALNHAIREELITRNVAELVTLPKVRKRKRTAWTSDEARRFLESARDARDPMYAGYVLALVLGLRKGEILGLTWGALDFDHGELAVTHQLQRASKQLLHRETKTDASDDTLPLPSIVVAALEQRRRQQLADRKEADTAWHKSDLVFTTKFGLPIDPRNFNRSWDNRVARSGVRKITVHDGRRSCGTLLVDLDVHPRVIMAILRHAEFSVTMEIYAQASSQKTRDALKRLGESLDQ